MKPKRKAKPKPSPAYADFMARAYTMELDATERYTQFADQMEAHNNAEVAQLFRRLAQVEALHAKRILAEMGWPSVPALPVAFAWPGAEAPETPPFDELHYLMQPYHALKIALRCEEQAVAYFSGIARRKPPKPVLAAAKEMAEEEREHVKLIQEWLALVPKPTADWDHDMDPPAVTE